MSPARPPSDSNYRRDLRAEREAFLVSRVLERDLRAFHELFEDYKPRLTRFLARMIQSAPLVDEIVNDTMMVVWEKLDTFKGESKLSTWIFAIAYRKGAKSLKKYKLQEPLEDKLETAYIVLENNQESHVQDKMAHNILRDAMAQLSSDHRIVVDLAYFHDMGYREIAEIMNSPVDTIKTRMFHARRALKKALSGNLEDWL